jgi:hypothetical protein
VLRAGDVQRFQNLLGSLPQGVRRVGFAVRRTSRWSPSTTSACPVGTGTVASLSRIYRAGPVEERVNRHVSGGSPEGFDSHSAIGVNSPVVGGSAVNQSAPDRGLRGRRRAAASRMGVVAGRGGDRVPRPGVEEVGVHGVGVSASAMTCPLARLDR